MKRAISAKTDFTEQNLPHNRWQLFGDLFKHRFGFLMKAGLLTALFFLPYFVWNTIMLEELRLLADTVTETNAYEVAVKMLALSNTKNAVNVLFFGICAIGISGGVSVIQKCAWGEIVFISDFFVALKRDWLKDFFFGVILGLSYWLAEYAIRFVPLSTLDTTVSVLMYGITTVQFVLIAVMTMFSICQNAVYQLSILKLLKNSFAFTFKGFFPMFGIMICVVCPVFLLFVNNMIVDIVAAVMFSLILGFGLLGIVLYADSLFDKYINKDNYPQLVDKNINRTQKNDKIKKN